MTVFQTPNAQIRAGDRLLETDQLHALSRIRVQQVFSLPAQCELVFQNPSDLSDLLETFQPGTNLKVSASTLGGLVFEGEVTVIEQQYGPAGQMELRIRGYDALHRLRKHQAQRVFQNLRLSDLASELCSEAGANLSVVITSSNDPLLAELIQSGQSDFELLRQTADRRGLYLCVHDGSLEIYTLTGNGNTTTLSLGENLFEARIEVSVEAASPSVQAAGWSPFTAETYSAEASFAQVSTSVGGSNGSSPTPYGNPREVWNTITFDESHAQAVAQSELDRRAAHSMHVWGVAEGDPALRPGAVVEIEGVDASVRGSYTITSAIHIISSTRGYQTEFSTLPPPPQAQAGAGMTLGMVSDVDDPQALGRIRVRMPAFGDYESSWMHVVLPAAGANKGLMSLPAPGDTVLVLFPLDEPTQGFVLGGLYGMQGMPDSGVEGGAVKRYTLLTPEGQRLTLDDAGHKIRFEDSTGSFVELSPEKTILHAAVDLLLEAPGRRIVVRGQNIDFERG